MAGSSWCAVRVGRRTLRLQAMETRMRDMRTIHAHAQTIAIRAALVASGRTGTNVEMRRDRELRRHERVIQPFLLRLRGRDGRARLLFDSGGRRRDGDWRRIWSDVARIRCIG